MADTAGGHWDSLAECQKLTQSMLIPGVIQETIKRASILEYAPVAQAANSGQSIKWLRENTTTEDDVANVTIGTQLSWTEGITYTERETELKISYLQRKLDKFVQTMYGNINNYQAIKLAEMQKGVLMDLGSKMIYDDITYGDSKQVDGLHALAAEQTGTSLDIDEGEGALSLNNVRVLLDAMQYGCDMLYMPFCLGRRIDASYQEAGIASYVGMGQVSFGWTEAGKRITFFDSVPIVRTDYLVAEDANTGRGSDARTTDTGGFYSMFGIKFGQVMQQQPGLSVAFGGTSGFGQFFKVVVFDELEDYDAGGLRVVTYTAPLLGSTKCLARIHDITDAAVTD